MSAALLALCLGIAILVGARPAIAQTGPDATVTEDAGRLAVTIDGRAYALDALIVRRPGTDKLPVAIITHGSAPGDPHLVTTDWLSGWAHDFANRGWLAVAVMRRGYGKSDGDVAEDAGTCAAPDVGRYLDAHADDLEAALHAIAQRSDTDMSRVIAIGDSAGGAAVMALAARSQVRLSAVINVSGGLGRRLGPFRPDPTCDLYRSDLVWNFARFGATARAPTLWLYAENDSWFSPGLVGRMRGAFISSGGKAELEMLPPFGTDGHSIFFAAGGKQLLLPPVDHFLRANGLPTWDAATFASLLARSSAADRQAVEDYLNAPTEKALALGAKSGTYWHYGDRSLEEARTKVLAYCKRETKADCVLAAQNFELVSPPAAKER